MKSNISLILNGKDPKVLASQKAEQKLYSYYELKTKDYYIHLVKADIKMRVTEIGTGKPIILVPGNTGDAFPLIPLMAELKGRRIIAINRPGGGLSDGMDYENVDFRELTIETIETVMNTFQIDSAPFVGHSIGGHWCQWFAMDRPERVEALVLLGVPGNIINTCPPLALRMLSIHGINSVLYRFAVSEKREKALNGLKFMGHSEETLRKLPEAMAECYYNFQQLPNYKKSSLSMMESINRPWGSNARIKIRENELRSIKHPVLYLWGTNDPFGSIAAGRHIAGYVKNSVFHEVQNAGHLPWLDKAQECGAQILGFLAKNDK